MKFMSYWSVMKIITIKAQLKKIPLKTPFITALRRVENVEFVRVSIECDNGMIAIGEAPATKAVTGEGIDDILESISIVKARLINLTLEDALMQLHLVDSIGNSAKAALDMAFVSLIAQEKDKPLYRFFGLNEPIKLQTDITISLGSRDKMLEDSLQAYSSGMEILKIKLGKDIVHAIEVTKVISKTVPKAMLIIDANQSWSVEDSLKYIESLKDVAIELIEQPVIAHNIEGLKLITSFSHIPILADEAVFSLEDAKKVIESKSADMINIKLMKCGGLTKAVEILEYAREMGVKCMLGSMLEGPYSINAALHLAMAYGDVIKYIDLDSPLLYKEPSSELEFNFISCKIVYNQHL